LAASSTPHRGHFIAANAILTDMDKAKILQAAKTELMLHDWDTFVTDPPAIGQGGKGLVVPGCTHCKKRINTTDQFIRHLADDVLPVILRKAFQIASE
jgi:hypothetical protein